MAKNKRANLCFLCFFFPGLQQYVHKAPELYPAFLSEESL
jgi:hypothetical protein